MWVPAHVGLKGNEMMWISWQLKSMVLTAKSIQHTEILVGEGGKRLFLTKSGHDIQF